MNKIAEFFKTRPISFYLRVVAAILAFIPVFYMATRIEADSKYIGAIVCAVLVVAAQVALACTERWRWSDYIEIVGVVLIAAELSLFIAGGVLDMVDYIFEINFWGDATQFSAILAYGIVIFIGLALSLVSCFMNKVYEKRESGKVAD